MSLFLVLALFQQGELEWGSVNRTRAELTKYVYDRYTDKAEPQKIAWRIIHRDYLVGDFAPEVKDDEICIRCKEIINS